ncbi:SDR family NAD(P)-dependent oxidoreductase [Sabulicella rubraurantiaca]|uniref:SDR family NAD(P)-dependent oxidoreductase n=1 Tax=Sabulicella rubraurantiaca TaxID=2811429 RepID=UPI001A971379|nr:SDR family NAD(P)-dependent oxidoreductase [Sabulicella rubraurantiaca]
MDVKGAVAIVTGGASGLGLATAKRLASQGAKIMIVDLATSNGEAMAKELGGGFAVADVADEGQMQDAVATAEKLGPVRVLVHCAGRGGALRILEKDGTPGSLAQYEAIIRVNLTGSFNALRLAAAAMAKNDAVEGERGVCILTASIAGYEGQIGQIPYASSKAGVIGMTLVAARDLASKGIRVCTIAPGIMDTPMLQRLSDPVKQSLAQGVPNPHRLGLPEEYGRLAAHIVENGYLNGETIRLDGALRMAPR